MLGRGIRSKGERDGEGESGYTDPVDSISKSKSKSTNALLPSNDEPRSSRLPRELALATSCTSFLHCVKSLITFSLTLNFFSFPRLESTSCTPALVVVPSLVRTRDKPVELLSLRIAAASRSGHSDLFTNSNWGSSTPSTL